MVQKDSSLVFLHYLTTVFDNIGDAVLLIGIEPNETYRLLMANEAFFVSTGHNRKVVGGLIKDIVYPKSYESLRAHYKEVLTTKKEVEYTEWYEVPSGRVAYYVKIIPILNAVGEVMQLAAITRNVTELETLRAKNSV